MKEPLSKAIVDKKTEAIMQAVQLHLNGRLADLVKNTNLTKATHPQYHTLFPHVITTYSTLYVLYRVRSANKSVVDVCALEMDKIWPDNQSEPIKRGIEATVDLLIAETLQEKEVKTLKDRYPSDSRGNGLN